MKRKLPTKAEILEVQQNSLCLAGRQWQSVKHQVWAMGQEARRHTHTHTLYGSGFCPGEPRCKKRKIRPLNELTIGGDDWLTEEWEVISNQFGIQLRMLNNNIPVTLLIW